MKNLTAQQKRLFFCLIAELAILLVGTEFFNPFPISEIAQNEYMVIMTAVICFVSCIIGIACVAIYGIGQNDKGIFSNFNGALFVVSVLFTLIIPYLWQVINLIIVLMTVVFIVILNRKSSESWGFFLVLIKNKNI